MKLHSLKRQVNTRNEAMYARDINIFFASIIQKMSYKRCAEGEVIGMECSYQIYKIIYILQNKYQLVKIPKKNECKLIYNWCNLHKLFPHLPHIYPFQLIYFGLNWYICGCTANISNEAKSISERIFTRFSSVSL